MIVFGLVLVALSIVGFASSALDDDPDARWFDMLLFLLVLVGVAHEWRERARQREEDAC